MSDPIVAVDSSEIREGRLEDVIAAIERLVAFVETNEPEAIAYGMYVDEDERLMTVVQVHPSSEAMELHMEVAAPVFREFADLLTLRRVDFYGRPSEKLLDQMRRKAQLLGEAPVFVHELQAGFTRFGEETSPTGPSERAT